MWRKLTRMSTPRPLTPPPADWEPGPAAGPRSVPAAAPAQRAAPGPDPEPDPDIPFTPLEPGELLEHVVDSGSMREEDLPPASRVELAARRARRAAAEPAEPVTDDTLATLRRLLRAAEGNADIGPALKALEMLEKRSGPGADNRTARELTRAELTRIAAGGD